MAKDGYIFLVPTLLVGLLAWWADFTVLAVVFFLLAAFLSFFFRDPERSIPQDPRAVVSPADGKVILVKDQGEMRMISIFLSVFDVHVNRAPVDGMISRQEYRPGKFLLAWDERASVENEQLILTISGHQPVTFSLIAGILARRIRFWKKEGDQVRKGDRIGLIRFGSRVDVFFPAACRLAVQKGDRVHGGTSIIAYWSEET